MSVIGALKQGQAAKDAGDYNAAINQRNSQIALDQGAVDEARQRRENAQRLGTIRAGVGASGVQMEGSPLDILAMSAQNGELDAQAIKYKANLRSMGYKDTATLDTMQGDNAQTASYYKAGSELLSGGSKVYGQLYPQG